MASITPMQGKPDASKPSVTSPPLAPPKNKVGRPRKDDPPVETGPAFWAKVAAVPADDWAGELACMYVYVTEPICNLKVAGQKSHLVKLKKPIFDLQPLMEDYGSFRGFITLNLRKINETMGPQLAKYEFEIFNPKFPPKIPKEVWMDDPRNNKWKALLPPDQQPGAKPPTPPPPPTPDATSQMLNTLIDIEDRVADRMKADEAPIVNPVDQMRGMAEIMQSLKGDSGIGDILKILIAQSGQASQLAAAQIETSAKAIEAERQANRELAKELRAAGSKAPELDPIRKKLEEKMVDKLFNQDESSGPSARSKMGPWQEFFQPVVAAIPNSPVLSQLAEGFKYWMMGKFQESAAKAQQTRPPQPQAQQAQAQPQPAATAAIATTAPQEQTVTPAATETIVTPMPMPTSFKIPAEMMAPFVKEIIGPLTQHLQREDKDGWDLAQWVIDGRGMTAYLFVKNQGADTIMQAFRLSEFWPELSGIEPQLKEFVEQFCTWPPPDDDEGGEESDTEDVEAI
jgi:hypothetical protein